MVIKGGNHENIDTVIGRLYNVAIVLLIICTIGFASIAVYSTHRLAETQRELEHVRAELESSHDRFGEIADTVARTRTCLSTGADTIAELRGQIEEIRISYEAMENIVNRYHIDNGYSYDSTDIEIRR